MYPTLPILLGIAAIASALPQRDVNGLDIAKSMPRNVTAPCLPPGSKDSLVGIPTMCFPDTFNRARVNRGLCGTAIAAINLMGSAARQWQPQEYPYEWADAPLACSIQLRSTTLQSARFSPQDIVEAATRIFNKCDRVPGFGGVRSVPVNGVDINGWLVTVWGKHDRQGGGNGDEDCPFDGQVTTI